MDHADIRRKLPAYLDNDVSAEEKQEIKKHLGVCGICRGALADLELTMWHLKHLPEVEPPPWLSDKILTKVLSPAEPKPGIRGLFFSPFRRRPLLAALVIVLLCGIGYFVFRTFRPAVMVSAPTSTSRKATPRLTPAVPEKSPGTLTPPRALPPTSTLASPVTPPVVPPSGGEAPAPAPALAPAPAPAPAASPPPEELEQEKALPGREPLQPFGHEE